MNAEIVAIGSELLLGQIVDSNSAWIAQRLAENGVNLFYKTVVGDNRSRMLEIISHALDRADVVITTGGIGPTQDDLTREVVAKTTGRHIVVDSESLKELDERVRKRGFILTKNNESQAEIPEGAHVIKNPNGTAPAFVVEDKRGIIISLPGVPFEMKWLIENEVLPYLRSKFDLSEVIHYKVLKVADLGESNVDHLIGHLIASLSNPTVGVLAHPGQVDVRIAARAKNVEAAAAIIAPIEAQIRSLLGDHIFAQDNETIEDVVGGLLRRHSLSISTYEDVSGGSVAGAVSQAAGDLFMQGITVNSDEARERLLKSAGGGTTFRSDKERAEALARAVCRTSGSALGIAVHGLLDDDNQTENLGRGETYIALVGDQVKEDRHTRSAGRGRPDRRRAAMQALSLLRSSLSSAKQVRTST